MNARISYQEARELVEGMVGKQVQKPADPHQSPLRFYTQRFYHLHYYAPSGPVQLTDHINLEGDDAQLERSSQRD